MLGNAAYVNLRRRWAAPSPIATTKVRGHDMGAKWSLKAAVAVGTTVVGALALVGFAIVDDWPPAAWGAAAAWMTVVIAGAAGIVGLRQYHLAQQLRAEQAQPYAVAYLEPSAAGDFYVDLVVRNFGATAAHHVRLTIDPPAQRHAGSAGMVRLPDEIPVLVPGQEWRAFWDTGQRAESKLPRRHEAVVAFSDSHGRELPAIRSILDWDVIEHHRGRIDVFGVHHVAKALRELNKTVATWRKPGQTGLAVTTWDGDAKDRRQLERLKAEDGTHDPGPAT
jgi:hypothetical protein